MTTSQIASTIVTLVEKHLGTGFDPVTCAVLTHAVAEYLEEEALVLPPTPETALWTLDALLSRLG
jgi:hypothetical protein